MWSLFWQFDIFEIWRFLRSFSRLFLLVKLFVKDFFILYEFFVNFFIRLFTFVCFSFRSSWFYFRSSFQIWRFSSNISSVIALWSAMISFRSSLQVWICFSNFASDSVDGDKVRNKDWVVYCSEIDIISEACWIMGCILLLNW